LGSGFSSPPNLSTFPAPLRGFAPKNPAFQKMVFVGVDVYWLERHKFLFSMLKGWVCNQSPSLVLVVK
ncbi:MAG: hypothetical protein II957_08980, partial [Treponema sp.]|nr:hypothetical protein [Treponema sp.]